MDNRYTRGPGSAFLLRVFTREKRVRIIRHTRKFIMVIFLLFCVLFSNSCKHISYLRSLPVRRPALLVGLADYKVFKKLIISSLEEDVLIKLWRILSYLYEIPFSIQLQLTLSPVDSDRTVFAAACEDRVERLDYRLKFRFKFATRERYPIHP